MHALEYRFGSRQPLGFTLKSEANIASVTGPVGERHPVISLLGCCTKCLRSLHIFHSPCKIIANHSPCKITRPAPMCDRTEFQQRCGHTLPETMHSGRLREFVFVTIPSYSVHWQLIGGR